MLAGQWPLLEGTRVGLRVFFAMHVWFISRGLLLKGQAISFEKYIVKNVILRSTELSD